LSWDLHYDLALTRWREGKSAGDIAKELRAAGFHDCSRSAVAAKMNRAGERRLRDGHDTSANRRAGRMGVRVQRGHHVRASEAMRTARTDGFTPLPKTLGAVEGSIGVAFLSREFGQCAWIIDGEGVAAVCCGAPKARGAYCAEHGAAAYVGFSGGDA
jgi:hypothetical protein